jgi:hypothetical protein
MIRIAKVCRFTPEKVTSTYYSLSDFIEYLQSNRLIKRPQCIRFYNRVQRFMIKKMTSAVRNQFITDSDEPLILHFNDWFLNWAVWESIFDLLPEITKLNQSTKRIFREIDYNEGVLYPEDYDKIFIEHKIEIPYPDYWEK